MGRARGSPGDKRTRARAFLGIISARKVYTGELLTYTNPRPEAEEGANARPGDAAERRKNASPGAALEAGYAAGIAADGLARVKERAAEPVAAAEGNARAGASTAERMHTLPDATFSMKNRLVQYLVSAHPSRRSDRFTPLILLISAPND